MKLTIEHLAAYLPYGVVMYGSSDMWKMTALSENHISIFNGIYLSNVNFENISIDYSLLLRPLSDLTKEIEHNGERFVPIDWFEIGDDSNDSVEYDNGNIKLIRSLESLSKNGFANEVEYFPYGVITKLLSWHFDIYSLIPQGLAIPIKPIRQ